LKPSLTWAYEFVSEHQEFVAQIPHPMKDIEANAVLYENLTPFLQYLQALITKNNYHPTLILNIDETSCEARRRKEPKRLFPARCQLFSTLSVPPIFHTTILFAVNSDGNYLRSNLIFPEDINLSFLSAFSQSRTLLHQTKRGWMDKDLFSKIIRTSLVPDISKLRSELPTGASKRCLLLLDGHSSRVNRELMVYLASQEIDVIVLPSHTSSLTQPLDRTVNGSWKDEIKRRGVTFPKRKHHAEELIKFVRELEHCAHIAQAPLTIREGFAEIGIGPGLTTNKLIGKLEHGTPMRRTEAQTQRFTICGRELTRKDFLHLWEEHDKTSAQRKICTGERISKRAMCPSHSGKAHVLGDPEDQTPDIPEILEEDDEEMAHLLVKPVQIRITGGPTEEDFAEENERKKVLGDLANKIQSKHEHERVSCDENDLMIIEHPDYVRSFRRCCRKARFLSRIQQFEESDSTTEMDDFSSDSSFTDGKDKTESEKPLTVLPRKRMVSSD
jgi:hypothetical protein